MGSAVVIGAGGGIGRSLAHVLVARGSGTVYALSRTPTAVEGAAVVRADVTDEASLAAAAASVGSSVQQVWVATGVLKG